MGEPGIFYRIYTLVGDHLFSSLSPPLSPPAPTEELPPDEQVDVLPYRYSTDMSITPRESHE